MSVLPETAASRCPRCDGELWMQLKAISAGDPLAVQVLPLCPHCDADDEAAQGLLAFFALHGAVGPDTVDSFAALVAQWISRLPSRVADPAALELDCAEALNDYFNANP